MRQEFIQLVEKEVSEARARAYKILGQEPPMYMCKWENCMQEVTTNKGLGAFCVNLQMNGKTHRQMHLEEKRQNDPSYGRHHGGRKKQPEIQQTASTNGNISWLGEVKREILTAMHWVEKAEADLEAAKTNLRKTLADAQEAVQ